MDLKTAYKIMGIPEDASIDQLEKQYMLWIRKEKAQQDQRQEGAQADNNSIDMDKITEAYYLIKNPDSDFTRPEEEETNERIGFLNLYKYHLIGLLLFISIVGYFVYNFIDHRAEEAAKANLPTPDFEVLIMGNFDINLENIPLLEDRIKKEFPEWKNVKINYEQSSVGEGVQIDFAKRPALLMTLRENTPDMYLVDAEHFDILFDYELFAPINMGDELTEKEDNDTFWYNQLDGESEQLYGVNMADSAILNAFEFGNDEVIAAIRDDSPKQENAQEFIKQ
ncbi:hypothetical protein, partial [Salipaludibacillus sp. CF4.18]|uniref:hypothetical protein n=1 Tax=Salipaludibacillus sp. CF4.18 TaxID=3373081 RepID=UPI003EE696AA